ncbi:hypothetical protein C5F48_22465, partial [Cereibacter changlensis JA139]
ASSYAGLVTSGVLVAHADVSVEVKVQVYMMARIGDVVIDAARMARISAATGDYQEFSAGNIYVNDAVAGNPVTPGEAGAELTISVNVKERAHYDYFAAIQQWLDVSYNTPNELTGESRKTVPNLAPDLYILGSVINELGGVTISNPYGAVRVSGAVSGLTVNIMAGGDFSVVTDWYHSGTNPQLAPGLQELALETHSPTVGTVLIRTYSASQVPGFNAQIYNTAQSSAVVANGAISIVASYVNLNGLIQSGVTTAEITIGADFVPPSTSTSIVRDDGAAIAGISFGTVNGMQVPVAGRWDAALGAIILNDMRFDGGRIDITGQVFATGAGKLVVAAGYASVVIRNNSSQKLVVNQIDASKDRTGVIQITDLLDRPAGHADAVAKRTTYTQTADGITTTISKGVLQSSGISFTQLSEAHSSGNTATFTPKAGTYYVFTQGLANLTQTIETRYISTFSFIFNWPAGSGNLYSSSTANLSDAPLLESQALMSAEQIRTMLELGANAALPDAFVKYKHISNPEVQLVAGAIIKNTTTGAYFVYNGSAELNVELSTLFESNGALKDSYSDRFTVTTSASFTGTDRDKKQYLSTFKNASTSARSWTSGGGYMRKTTYWNETTTIVGNKEYWDIGVKADNPVTIEFQKGAATPSIRIESVGDLVIAGNIATTPTGKVFLNPRFSLAAGLPEAVNGGAISTEEGASITGQLQAIRTKGAVDLTLLNIGSSAQARSATSGNVQIVDIETESTIRIGLGSDTNSDGSVLIKRAVSTGGDVFIRAPQGIYAYDANALISGDRVELQSSAGSIGSADLVIRIDTDASSTNGGFAAAAQGDIHVTEISGDLLLVQPTEIAWSFVSDEAGPVSVGSKTGTVALKALAGSIVDANFETDSALTDARLEAYRAALGLSADARATIGAMLDDDTRAEYALYSEYWALFRADLGDSATSADFTSLSTYTAYVEARVAAGADKATVEAELQARFGAVHDEWHDRPYTDSVLYDSYYRLLWSASDSAGSKLEDTVGYAALVKSRLETEVTTRLVTVYGALHANLGGQSVATGSVVGDYIRLIHADGGGDLASLPTLAAYVQGQLDANHPGLSGEALEAKRAELTAAAVERFGSVHAAYGAETHAVLMGYVTEIRDRNP